MAVATLKKSPIARLPVLVDWSEWLTEEDEDTIAESTWSADDGLDIVTHTYTDITTIVWIDSGVTGKGYDLTNTIYTVGGRTDERVIRIVCNDW
jgi:hypothetical protein